MGIKEQISLNNGLAFSYSVEESEQLKKLQRTLAKEKASKKGEKKSKNFNKVLTKIQKEYQKNSNKKANISKQIFSLIESYKFIAMQDEMLKAWQ